MSESETETKIVDEDQKTGRGDLKDRVERRFGFQMNIGGRLATGFIVVGLVLAAVVGITFVEVQEVDESSQRIAKLRVPTAASSAEMVNNINASLATLRGWMLTGNKVFKRGRAAVWADIDKVSKNIDRLSANWTNPANRKKWADFKVVLAEFRAAQKKVEDIANTPAQFPANVILFDQAAPRASIVIKEITALIDAEAKLEATAERKALLGIMADVRGTMGLSLANIRAFLLSGDAKFKVKFDKLWAKNVRRFADLQKNQHLMTPSQKAAFKRLSAARAEFAPLPPRMFEIRASKRWNMANYTLVTEAAPRAGKLLTILVGAADQSGARAGGMVANQKRLLANDAQFSTDKIDELIWVQMLLLVIGLVMAGFAAFLTARSIVKPVKAMTDAMGILAGGDTSIEVPAIERHDEIGAMAKTVQVFKENAIEVDRLKSEQEANEKRAAEEKAKLMNNMADEFQSNVGGVVESVSSSSTEMQSSAKSMSDTADETKRLAGAVAAASEQATNNVQTVATAAEELSTSINEISRQVGDSAKIAKKAQDMAETTNSSVQSLAETAKQVGDVVDLISDIAEQTNLLALNATIEAARAGDAGKGFAVVASEVKDLATQTAKATEEIATQITGIQEETGGAVTAIEEIGKTISEINEIATAVASAVEEQGAATQEIARNVQEAAQGTQDVSTNISGVTEAAGEAGKAAEQVLEAAGDLTKQSDILSGEVDKFVNSVRTGT